MIQVVSSGAASSHIQPPPIAPANASASAATLHSKVSGRNAVNDDGGGLFTLLEQGDPRYADVFERVFGTPHGVDLAALCAATGTPHCRVGSTDELRAELAREPSGIRVLEVRTGRNRTRDLHARLRAAVHDAVT
jgi:2-succinyl-5-enolpyruvyl-6-hydroxy-3-cyclohexene-1-carboxylate synthase